MSHLEKVCAVVPITVSESMVRKVLSGEREADGGKGAVIAVASTLLQEGETLMIRNIKEQLQSATI